jgi:hypothetical protein
MDLFVPVADHGALVAAAVAPAADVGIGAQRREAQLVAGAVFGCVVNGITAIAVS